MNNKRGFALITVIFIGGIVLIAGALLAGLIICEQKIATDEAARLKSFWAAEAGIEWAKARLDEDPLWCTDPTHPGEEDKQWLVSGAAGITESLNDVSFKVVKEEGINAVYSVGYTESSIADTKAISFIMIRFQTYPFRQALWQEI